MPLTRLWKVAVSATRKSPAGIGLPDARGRARWRARRPAPRRAGSGGSRPPARTVAASPAPARPRRQGRPRRARRSCPSEKPAAVSCSAPHAALQKGRVDAAPAPILSPEQGPGAMPFRKDPPVSFTIPRARPRARTAASSSAPGSRPELFPKMAASAADVINLDLEDSVPPADKAAARANIIKAIGEIDWGDQDPLGPDQRPRHRVLVPRRRRHPRAGRRAHRPLHDPQGRHRRRPLRRRRAGHRRRGGEGPDAKRRASRSSSRPRSASPTSARSPPARRGCRR